MIKDRWNERLAFLAVDVVRKDGSTNNASSTASKARCVSGVTNGPSGVPNDVEGCGDTCSSPSPPTEQHVAVVDWTTLTILEKTMLMMV
jgi:hypothetical protein